MLMGSIWCKTAQNVPSHRPPLLKFWGDKERALWYFMVFSGVANTHTGAYRSPWSSHVSVKFLSHVPIVLMNFPWVSEVVVKSRDFHESRRETQRKTCRLSLISSEMICSRLIALFLACFINCSHSAVSVAKPSAAQAKYLDYEIGASIHFNMQTFNRSMKAGKDFGIILLLEKWYTCVK